MKWVHGLALLLCAAPLAAQSCYVQLDDATGVPLPPAQLSELEVAACELRAAFPVEFQGDFAVYDFGFYLHQEGFAGGVPEVFQAKVAEVESESAYFLLFGRQLSRGGGVAEIWLKAKLPSTGAFSCQEADFYSMVEFKVRWAVSQAAAGGPGTPESIASAEVQGIQALRGWVEEIVECCDLNLRAGTGCSLCSWAYTDVVDYHAQMGFATYETEVSPPSDGLDSLCLCSYDYQVNSAEHVLSTGAVNMSVSFSTLDLPGIGTLNATDIFSFLSDLGEFYAAEGTAFYAALSDQTMFCSTSDDGPSAFREVSGTSTGHDEIEAAFGACEVGVWYNVLYTDHTATLAVKVKGIDVEGAMWLLGFSNPYDPGQGATEFAKFMFDAASEGEYIRYDRARELWDHLQDDANALLGSCQDDQEDDLQEWADLASFVPSGFALQRIENSNNTWSIQRITDARGARVNLDYFAVVIDSLPFFDSSSVRMTPKELLDHFRKNINDFAPTFEPYDEPYDEDLWQGDNPLGSVLHIKMGFGVDGDVLTAQYEDCCWIFTTLRGPFWWGGVHPVSGNRLFGYSAQGNQTIIYTKGADRATAWYYELGSFVGSDPLKEADKFWRGMQQNLSNYVIEKGGKLSATPLREVIHRPNWAEVRQLLMSGYPIISVPCP